MDRYKESNKMAKPIKVSPTIRGKAARRLREMLASPVAPSAKRIEQNKKDIATYLASTAS